MDMHSLLRFLYTDGAWLNVKSSGRSQSVKAYGQLMMNIQCAVVIFSAELMLLSECGGS